MRTQTILTFTFLSALVVAALLLLLSNPALAGNSEEEDWSYDNNDFQRYMEIHLQSDGSDYYLPHEVEAAENTKTKSATVQRVGQNLGGGGGQETFATWSSNPLLKTITSNRADPEDDKELQFSIYVNSESDDGSTDRVYVQVTIDFGVGGTVSEEIGPMSVNTAGDPTRFGFKVPFSDRNTDQGEPFSITVNVRTEEEYDDLPGSGDDPEETVTMSFGSRSLDSFLKFEANTLSVSVETNSENEVAVKKMNGIAYANVSFIHAFGPKVLDDQTEHKFYIRIYGPALEDNIAGTKEKWNTTTSWNRTRSYIDNNHNIITNTSTVPIIWQVQDDMKDPGIKGQYEPVDRDYFLYFKGWDVFPENNDTPAEMNSTFRMPNKFPDPKSRIELEWAKSDILFYNKDEKRFYPTDEENEKYSIAVGDSLFLQAKFKILGGSSEDVFYDNITIEVKIFDSAEELIFNLSSRGNYQGQSSHIYRTPAEKPWVPEVAGENYTVVFTINPDESWPEYDYGNNVAEINVTVYENRSPTALISSPRSTLEDDEETYVQVGEFILFDATNSFDPDSDPLELSYDWTIENVRDTVERTGDSFELQRPAGDYKVTLIVSDGIRSDMDEVLFSVNSPPEPNSGSNGIVEPEDEKSFAKEDEIRFTALYTDDNADKLYYTWRSEMSGLLGEKESLENFVEVTDLPTGQHNISVTVTDMHGGEHVSEITIFINNLPIVIIDTPTDNKAYGTGEEITFDASLSFDVEDGSGEYLVYVWYYSEDGTTYKSFGSSAVTDYTFRSAGEYQIKVDVYDSMGGISSKELTIDINGQPIAKIGKVSGDGLERTFDGSASYDPDGEGIDRYIWDFDTNYDSDNDGDPGNDKDAEGVNPSYKFNSTGTFNISLTVVDNDGVWGDQTFMDLKVKKKGDDDLLALPVGSFILAITLATLLVLVLRRREI